MCWSQDVYSYNAEVLHGMGFFNLVTIIMYEHGLETVKQAIARRVEWATFAHKRQDGWGE